MTTKKYPLTNDCVFHIVFGREETKNNLLYLLNTVFAEIGLPLTENVTIMNPIDYGEAVQVKSVVFDIKAKTSNDNLVNIEMQREDSSNYISRSYIYLSRIHGEQLKKGDKYEQIKPTYGVSFLNFVIFKEFPDYINSLIPSFDKHKEYEIKDFQIVYIEMPKVPVIKKNSTAFEKLIYLLHNADRMEDEMANEIVFEDPALGQIYQDYLKINENHQFISLIEAKEKFWRDTEARKDFIEARKDFFKAEGLAEGLAKGKAEGKAQKLREVVLRLMQRQFSATEIADMVGITPAEVQQIIANQA